MRLSKMAVVMMPFICALVLCSCGVQPTRTHRKKIITHHIVYKTNIVHKVHSLAITNAISGQVGASSSSDDLNWYLYSTMFNSSSDSRYDSSSRPMSYNGPKANPEEEETVEEVVEQEPQEETMEITETEEASCQEVDVDSSSESSVSDSSSDAGSSDSGSSDAGGGDSGGGDGGGGGD